MLSRHSLLFSASILLAASTIALGCSAPAAVPPPTSAPAAAAPTVAKAAPAVPTAAPVAPTTAPAAPTAAPAKAVDFPQKGRTINIIVTAPAGGGVDIVARVLAAGMEKELGVSVQVTNNGDAGGQTGATTFAQAKPDGYTMGAFGMPATNATYLNPERKAVYSRKSFVPIANHVVDPAGISVKSDSPYKTLKEFIDAAKANPGKITASANGQLTATHLVMLQFQKLTGTEFAAVMIAGDAPAATALIGGHVDSGFAWSGAVLPMAKNGDLRFLAIAAKQRSPFYPDVPTLTEVGINLSATATRGYAVPAGTPKEIVDILASAAKKVIEDPANVKKMEETGSTVRFMGPDEFATYWDALDAEYAPIIQSVAKP